MGFQNYKTGNDQNYLHLFHGAEVILVYGSEFREFPFPFHSLNCST